jgi:type I restriction enzyme S subunit
MQASRPRSQGKIKWSGFMLPEGWKIQNFSMLNILIVDGDRGKNYPKKSEYQAKGYCLFLGADNIHQEGISLESKIFIPKNRHLLLNKGIVNYDDILLVMRGNGTGRIGLYTRDVSEYKIARINSGLVIIRLDQSNLCKFFMLQLMKSDVIIKQFFKYTFGSAQPQLTIKILKSLLIPTPPLKEQKKIAKIFSTWDKAINTTQKLIDNSKQQKKNLMQQLLTGKKRFAGFEGEWKERLLHEVAIIISSPVNKKTIEGELSVELCNYTDVYYNTTITNKLNFMKATAKQSEIDKFTLLVGDVIITKDSETPGDIAIPALVSENLNGVVCGYHLAIVRPEKEKVDGAFLNYLFSMQKTRYYFFTLATGATRFGLSIGGINNAQFTFPPLNEQQKISYVLTYADKEIELLNQQLADLKKEKKALMQQLLTGKRRVKTNGSAGGSPA